MKSPTSQTAVHPSSHEQDIAVAIVLWIMMGGICVVLANAWAAGILPTA